MLFWTKYLIFEKLSNEKAILWHTLNSYGIVIYGNIADIEKSISKNSWMRQNLQLEKCLSDHEFLLTEEQSKQESKLVDKLRAEAVFDDTFMSLTIIPTDTCNFNCIYCYQSDTIHNMSVETADAIIKMIKKKKNLKKLHISWFGGEPLCNKTIVYYIMEKINNICRNNGIVLVGDMTTNASLLDIHTFERLYKLRVLNYQITVDGCKKTHDVQRPLKTGESSYDLIMKNLRDIRDNARGKFFKIGLRTNFTSFVDNDFYLMKETLEKDFSNDNRFYFFFQWVKNWGGNKITEIAPELLGDDAAISHYGRWMDIMSSTNVRTGDIALIRAGSGLCVGCRKNNYLINTDGTVCKCTTGIYDMLYKNKAIIGKIENNGDMVIDKWNEIDWISQDANLDECHNCSLYPICLGMPCPYYKIKHQQVICNKNTEYIRYMIRAFEKQGYLQSFSFKGEGT